MLRYSGKTFSFTKYGGETRELAYMEHHKKIHLNRTFWQFYDLLQQAPNTWKKGGETAKKCGLGKPVVNFALLMSFWFPLFVVLQR